MNKPTPADRKRKERENKRAQGLVPLEVWTHPQCKAALMAYAAKLNEWAAKQNKGAQ